MRSLALKNMLVEGYQVGPDAKQCSPSSLQIAVLSNNVEKVIQLKYEKNQDVNEADAIGIPPLTLAAASGNAEILRTLIDLGASCRSAVETQSLSVFKMGMTPLMIACYSNSYSAAKLLLERGSQVDIQDGFGRTALYYAVAKKNTKIAKILLQHDASLGFVIDSLEKEVCLMEPYSVLENLVSMKIVDSQGNTPITFAALQECDEILAVLLANEQNDVNTLNKIGESPLLIVLKWLGNEKPKSIVRFHSQKIIGSPNPLAMERRATGLVAHGADTSVKDSDGNTPLILAIMKGFTDLVKLILERDKSTVNTVNRSGTTALLVALRIKQTQTVKLLLEHGADVSVTDTAGNTPLILAVMVGKTELVESILKKSKSTINAVNKFGETALMTALQFKQKLIVQFLLNNGANVTGTDTNGNTPLILAANYGYIDLVKSILKRDRSVIDAANRNGDTALLIALKSRKKATAQVLLDHDADVNVTDIQGNTPFIIAIEKGFTILEGDNSLSELVNKKGGTTLPIAVKSDRLTTVKRLANYGDTVTAVGNGGNIPSISINLFMTIFLIVFTLRLFSLLPNVFSFIPQCILSFCSRVIRLFIFSKW